jgi:SAM-dependent methyltransferase
VKCYLCNSTNLIDLPDLRVKIRTDGGVVKSGSFAKVGCQNCGLVALKTIPSQEELNRMYSSEYELYNNRPEAESYNFARFEEIVNLTAERLSEKPANILEIGCGNGGFVQAFQEKWPDSNCIGIEPSASAVSEARKNNRNVFHGIIGEKLPQEVQKKFDLIYSFHVIEHVPNPVNFLQEIAQLMDENSTLVVSCPNSQLPNAEIIKVDHVWSFCNHHLKFIFEQAGFEVMHLLDCPGSNGKIEYEFNQIIFVRLAKSKNTTTKTLPTGDYSKMIAEKIHYFNRWNSFESEIAKLIGGKDFICFGIGGWTSLIKAFCPDLWKQNKAYVIDGGSNQKFEGKDVLDVKNLAKDQVILLGTNPCYHDRIKTRLIKEGFSQVISFNQIIAG